MSLADALAAAPQGPDTPHRPQRTIPAGWTPGYEWDGTNGTIVTTGLTERPKTWDEFLRDAGLDPETVDVIEPVTVRGWDATQRDTDGNNTTVRMHGYKLAVRKRGTTSPDVDALLKLIKRAKPAKAKRPVGDSTFVVALGDTQIGKVDGDGVEGTVNRAVAGIEAAATRLKQLRKIRPVGAIHIAWLGDGCEGFVSQGGDSAWRTTLPLTEQVRILRRLMYYAIETFAPLGEQVTQVAIPGNHDQAVRFGKGGVTTYSDSHDVEAMVALADALTLNTAAYGHVQTHVPGRDELTVTCETAGTILGHVHGHIYRPGKQFEWWGKQAFGEQPVGRADILLAGHLHHLHVQQSGPRTFIQVPALESESTWWRHASGEMGDPGVLTFTTLAGRVADLHVT